VFRIYSILDIFVNTSAWEGLPYIFLEAMYYKLPIVATDTGNDTAVIDGKSGYVSKVRDYQAIAAHINRLIDNKTMCSEMGAYGRQHLKQKYSFAIFIELHEKLYLRAAKNTTRMIDHKSELPGFFVASR
jgi:glycosyltransferase involved in cell wall biosynthesis